MKNAARLLIGLGIVVACMTTCQAGIFLWVVGFRAQPDNPQKDATILVDISAGVVVELRYDNKGNSTHMMHALQGWLEDPANRALYEQMQQALPAT